MSVMRAPGFTLIELLVVIAVSAVLLAVLAPALRPERAHVDVRNTAREFESALRQARAHAIRQNRSDHFVLDVDARSYRSGMNRVIRKVPANLELVLTVAAAGAANDPAGAIVFFPDGTSTGGSIEVAYEGVRYRVVVDWLTGRIATHE